MNGKLRKAAALAFAAAALCTFTVRSTSAEGFLKEEIVYASLASGGEPINIYVVNSFELKSPQTVTDYGTYEKVVNLTDTGPIKAEDGTIVLNAGAGRFYYQGDLGKAELPWLINIKYALDGKEIIAEEAAGKSGKLSIRIVINQNPDADPVFADNYTLQTTVSLPLDKCYEIKAPKAVVANSGGIQTLTFTLLPGSEAEYTVEADVKNFTMDGIRFGAVPLTVNLDLPVSSGMTDSFMELQDGIERLDNGAKALADGSGDLVYGMRKLRNGADSLKSGADELSFGLKELDSGATSLYEGSVQLTDGALELSNGLSALSENGTALNNGAEQIFLGFIDMINEQLKSRNELLGALDIELPKLTRDNYDQVLTELLNRIGGAAYQRAYDKIKNEVYSETALALETETVKELLERRGLSGKALQDAVAAAMENEKDKAFLLEQAESLLIIKAAESYVLARDPSQKDEALTQAADSALHDPDIQAFLINEVERQQSEAIDKKAKSMMADPAVQTQLSGSLPVFLRSNGQFLSLLQLKFQLDSIAVFCGGVFEYTSGAAEAAQGADKLYSGLDEVASGLGDLSQGTSGLSEGADEFADGAYSLCDGASVLYAGMKSFDEGLSDYCGGTEEFRARLSVLDFGNDIGGLLRSVGGSEFTPVSFTDSRNSVSLVQFVLMTGSIEAEEKPLPAEEPEEKLSFLKRLLALFGL